MAGDRSCERPEVARQPPEASKPAVEVVVGTAEHADDAALVEQLAALVNAAYSASVEDLLGSRAAHHQRVSEEEIRGRLRQGSAAGANRVLHVALRDGCPLGCVSSTLQPPWTPSGCGHWGLLAVAATAQGQGVASALVAAAEQRLAEAGCSQIQIEYQYTAGHAYSQRLCDWYEARLGFENQTGWLINRLLGAIVGRGGAEFRRCRRQLQPPAPAAAPANAVAA
mmetsp:Transcript_85587/g.227390  ORF Transcript_85587/g.227390 Transcript_85587/m.227390 type:complete len:225 (-) Transcript_85587:164-838(-)